MIDIYSYEFWGIVFSGISTLAIYSFLVKENAIYRIFEHFFIGIATAWGMVAVVKTFFWPNILKPVLGLDLVVFPDRTMPEAYDSRNLLFILPMLFGLLYYFILSRRWNWLAQLVIGFQLGIGGALAFKGTFNEMIPQLTNSFKPLYVPGDIGQTCSNLFFITTLISVSSYFFFTFKRKSEGAVAYVSGSGRWLMMGCFGAFFGSTIMARMALLVERLNFMFDKWFPAVGQMFTF
jgi:hypothetical protein